MPPHGTCHVIQNILPMTAHMGSAMPSLAPRIHSRLNSEVSEMSTRLLFNQSLLQGHGMFHSKRWMDLDDDGKPLPR